MRLVLTCASIVSSLVFVTCRITEVSSIRILRGFSTRSYCTQRLGTSMSMTSVDDNAGYRIEKAGGDWESFSEQMHQTMDKCLDRVQKFRSDDGFWKPPPADMRKKVALDVQDIRKPVAAQEVFRRMTEEILPYSTGNTHPKFFGWVHGSGLPMAIGADLVASTMNCNLGGRNQGAAEIERAVVEFAVEVSGLPKEHAFGILTSGTSQATILALSAARVKLFGVDVRKNGIRSMPEIRVYVSMDVHSCINKALEIMGHGSNCVSKFDGLADLKAKIEADKSNGIVPMAIVGTAGSVNMGKYDDLEAIGNYAQDMDIWYHVDAAFGFWILLADEPYRSLIKGIDKASSIAADFHKWMSIQYDCGVVLMRDKEIHRATFTSRPSYLSDQANNDHIQGLGSGDLWFCDYGMELSRGFKALKVWASLQHYGLDAFSAYITDNCKLAHYMGECVTAKQAECGISLAHPVVSNVCVFYLPDSCPVDPDTMASILQCKSQVVFSTTIVEGKSCMRAAIVNHRTTKQNIEECIEAISQEVLTRAN